MDKNKILDNQLHDELITCTKLLNLQNYGSISLDFFSIGEEDDIDFNNNCDKNLDPNDSNNKDQNKFQLINKEKLIINDINEEEIKDLLSINIFKISCKEIFQNNTKSFDLLEYIEEPIFSKNCQFTSTAIDDDKLYPIPTPKSLSCYFPILTITDDNPIFFNHQILKINDLCDDIKKSEAKDIQLLINEQTTDCYFDDITTAILSSTTKINDNYNQDFYLEEPILQDNMNNKEIFNNNNSNNDFTKLVLPTILEEFNDVIMTTEKDQLVPEETGVKAPIEIINQWERVKDYIVKNNNDIVDVVDGYSKEGGKSYLFKLEPVLIPVKDDPLEMTDRKKSSSKTTIDFSNIEQQDTIDLIQSGSVINTIKSIVDESTKTMLLAMSEQSEYQRIDSNINEKDDGDKELEKDFETIFEVISTTKNYNYNNINNVNHWQNIMEQSMDEICGLKFKEIIDSNYNLEENIRELLKNMCSCNNKSSIDDSIDLLLDVIIDPSLSLIESTKEPSFKAASSTAVSADIISLLSKKKGISCNDNKNNDELKSIEEEEITYLSTLTPPSSPSKKTVTGIKSPYFSQVQQINYNNNDDDGDNFMAKLQHSLNGNKINDTTDKNNNGKTFKYFSGKFSATSIQHHRNQKHLKLKVLDISKNKNEPTSTSIDLTYKSTIRNLPAPTTVHKYIISSRLLQNNRLLTALRSDNCKVELIERDFEYLKTFLSDDYYEQQKNLNYVEADLILDERTAMIYFPLNKISQIQIFTQFLNTLTRLAQKYSNFYLILENYTRKNNNNSDDMMIELSTTPYLFTLPTIKALANLSSLPSIHILYSTSEEIQQWESRDWMITEESLHENFLTCFTPFINPFTAQMILTATNLREFLAMSHLERRELIGDWIDEERLIQFNEIVNGDIDELEVFKFENQEMEYL
ncbi:8620_t:CDS:10 [Entrophospora sp. SA101]|nr:8620_t:CDS:10 [Entrophospora sp. SA101]